MPIMPAFCDSCGAIFSSGISIDNSTNISFTNCSAGPCPNCGGIGHIPDGLYNIIDSTIMFLKGPYSSLQYLQRLGRVLRSSQQEGSTIEEIKEKVAKEVSAFSPIINMFPQNRSEFYQFIAILLAIISLFIKQPDIEVNEIYNNIYNNITVANNVYSEDVSNMNIIQSTPVHNVKTGRNESCPCGSGIKYKKCCGK